MSEHTVEEWRPIPGIPNYEASSLGRVRSFRRRTVPLIRKPSVYKSGHLYIRIASPGGQRITRCLHHLVLEAFVGPRPAGMETRHLDGDPTNNALTNLKYGTRSENIRDRLRHGTHPFASKTHCIRGHEFTPENTLNIRGGTARQCQACQRERERASRERRKRAAA